MKLQVIYELNISPENEPLIPVIASMEGWTPDSGMTAQEYINENISKPRVSLIFKTLLFGAIERYFGVAGQANARAVEALYEDAHSISSEFITEKSKDESEPT
jgi:hypothetical protein